MAVLRIFIHFVNDLAEVRKITFYLAQESGQQEMGEFDRALLSIRDNQDDINLRQQLAERLHLLKLFPVRSREDGDRIRFNGHPDSLPEVVQAFKGFYLTFRDYLANRCLKSLAILIIRTCIKKQLHGHFSLCLLNHNQETCQVLKTRR